MKRLFIYVGLALGLVSCVVAEPIQTGRTTNTTYEYEYVIEDASARILEPEATMLLTPLIADLEVSKQRVVYVEKDAFADKVITREMLGNLDTMKAIALANAAQKFNADIMIGCTINVKTVNKRLEITVQGYPATYKNFRNATIKDIELVESAQIYDSSVSPIETSNKVVEQVIRK